MRRVSLSPVPSNGLSEGAQNDIRIYWGTKWPIKYTNLASWTHPTLLQIHTTRARRANWHRYTLVHTYKHTYRPTNPHRDNCTHAHTHASYINTYINPHTCIHTYTHTYWQCMQTHIHAYIHTYTGRHTLTHTHMYAKHTAHTYQYIQKCT